MLTFCSKVYVLAAACVYCSLADKVECESTMDCNYEEEDNDMVCDERNNKCILTKDLYVRVQGDQTNQCHESHSQCSGDNWPFAVCCKDPTFECKRKNDYLSLCEPKDQAKKALQYQQCGGKVFTGESICTTGYTCTKINEWYSQCQPDTNEAGLPTWAKCGGDKSYTGDQKCRAQDECKKYNDYYSQCIPRK